MGEEKEEFLAEEYKKKILMANITQLENSVEEVQVLDENQQKEVIKAIEKHLLAIDKDIKNYPYNKKVLQSAFNKENLALKELLIKRIEGYPELKSYLESIRSKNTPSTNFYEYGIFTLYTKDKGYRKLVDNKIEGTEKLNTIKQKVQDLKDKKEQLTNLLNSENSEDTKENLEKIKKENLQAIKKLYDKQQSQFYKDQFSKIILEERAKKFSTEDKDTEIDEIQKYAQEQLNKSIKDNTLKAIAAEIANVKKQSTWFSPSKRREKEEKKKKK